MRLFILTIIYIFFPQQALSDKITVVTENWAPYNYEENGVIKGSSTKIVTTILKRAKIDFEIKVLPWARAYHLALNGDSILIYTIVRTPGREKLFNWIRPVGDPDKNYLYKLKNAKTIPDKLSSLDQAKTFTIATNYESLWHQYLVESGFSEDSIQVVSSLPQVVKLLFSGRVQFMTDSERTIETNLKNEGKSMEDVQKSLFLFESTPYMAFSQKTPTELVNRVRSSFDLEYGQNKAGP